MVCSTEQKKEKHPTDPPLDSVTVSVEMRSKDYVAPSSIAEGPASTLIINELKHVENHIHQHFHSDADSKSPTKPSPEVEHIQSLQFEVSALQGRLKRRNLVIDAIRKAYLRDVVTIKKELLAKEENPESYSANSSTALVHRVPSLDMRPTLELFAPAECSLRVKPCETCGGQLEIIHRESKRVVALTKSCAELQKIEQEVRLRAARMEIQANKDRRALEEERSRAKADKEVFMRQISELRTSLAQVDVNSFEKMRKALMEMRKEMEGNEGKLSTFNALKSQLDELAERSSTMQQQLEDNAVQMRELERLKQEAEEEKEALARQVEEKDNLLSEAAKDKDGLSTQVDNLNEELNRAREKNQRIQQLLDESRKNEAYLKQKISAMEQEQAEVLEAEQQAQQELDTKLEETRNELRAKKKECDKLKKQLEQVIKDNEEGGAKMIEEKVKESQEKMQREYESVIEGLRKELGETKDNFEKSEKKLAAEQNMRVGLEDKIKAEKAEKLKLIEQVASLGGDLEEVSGKLDGANGELQRSKSLRVDSLAANLALKVKLQKGEEKKQESEESTLSLEEQVKKLKEDLDLALKEKELTQFELEQERTRVPELIEKGEIVKETIKEPEDNGGVTKKRQDSVVAFADPEKVEAVYDKEAPPAESAHVLAATDEKNLEQDIQLQHLMQKLKEQKIAEEQHKLEIEKHKLEVEEHKRMAAMRLQEIEKHRSEAESHKASVDEQMSLHKDSSEKFEHQLREMGDTLHKQQMQIELFEAQMAANIENSEDPEAARAQAEATKQLSREMEEKIAKSIAQRDEAHRLEVAAMMDEFKEKEEQLQREQDDLANVRRQSVDISKFAQLEVELERIPKLQMEIELLQVENTSLKSNIEELGTAESDKKDTGSGATSGALTMMLKAQIATLKKENGMLNAAKEDVDFMRLERDEMGIELKKTKERVKELETDIDDMQSAAVMKQAAGALPDVMKQAKLRKEREAAAKHDAEQIRFMTEMYDKTKQQLLTMASNVCDYVSGLEEDLSKDAVEWDTTIVDEGEKILQRVKGALDAGSEVEIVELASWCQTNEDVTAMVDYLDDRYRKVKGKAREEFVKLRDHRDNSVHNDELKKMGGGGVKIDFMAKQKEFRLTKKLEDAERKLGAIKDEASKVKAGLMEKLEETTERADKNERELRRVEQMNESLVPQVHAYESMKVEHEDLQVRYTNLEAALEEVSKELEHKKQDIKKFSTDLFKSSVKIKNYMRDIDDLEKKSGGQTVEIRKLKKDIKELRAEFDGYLAVEKERRETAEEVGCQVGVMTDEVGCQTDFVGKNVTLRQSNSIGLEAFPGRLRWAKPVVSVGEVKRMGVVEQEMRMTNSLLGLSMSSMSQEFGTSTGLPAIGPETGRSVVRQLRSASGIRGGSRSLNR